MGKKSQKAKSISSLLTLSFWKAGSRTSIVCLLLTFLTMIFLGLMAIWITIKIFGRHQPSIIQYDLRPKEFNPKIPWTTDDFKFGLSVLSSIEDAAFSYGVSYWGPKWSVDMSINSECKFDIVPGQNFKCFEQWENTKDKTFLDAKGTWNFFINYRSCLDDNPGSDDCFTENSMESYVKNRARTTLVYEDVAIDPNNSENPITSIENEVSALVWTDVGTTLVVELNEIEFTSDNGWIFEDLKTVKKFKATTRLEVSGNEMLSIQLLYGGKKTVYKRTYPKLQDFFAQISGFIVIITPIFFILISQYGNLQAVQHMINEIYEIKLNNDDAGDPQNSGGKRKRRSTGPATERNLLSKEAISKFKDLVRPTQLNQMGMSFNPHAALVIGCFDSPEKLPTKEDTSIIPEENIEPFRFDSLEKSPSSPLRSTLVSPRHEDSKLINFRTTSLAYSPQKLENGRLNENLEPVEAKEEIENQNLESEHEEENVQLRTSDPLKVSWKGWLKSFWKPSAEVQVMNKAKEHIMQNFDLATLSKKVIEIDKLKACLLTQDQRVIFENLPSSVIVLDPDIDVKSPEAIQQYDWDNSFKGDKEALRKAYSRLKGTKNELDKLLLKLYESEHICDGLSSSKD